jgi:hypothetical protein
MFHYAIDVIAGLLFGALAVTTFNRAAIERYYKVTSRGTCKE